MQVSTQKTTEKKRVWALLGIILCLFVVAGVVVIRIVIDRAEPILRARVIQTLSNRFQSRVELNSLGVSVVRGLEVDGSGLKIYGASDPNPYEAGVQPLISIREFHFHTGIRNLFRPVVHVDTVYVKGMELNIPPKESRPAFTKKMRSQTRKMSVVVDQFVCQDTDLLINNSNPEKVPLEFAIGDLKMKDIGAGLPMRFDATLVNPKPVGDIHSTGLFGPFHEENPRETPVQGDYSFSNADLGTLKGIGGILSSTGKYEGTLSEIVVNGSTDTPDFQIARSGHPVALHTDFHAIVDGTSGDTDLAPVKATLLHSSFTATGSVTRMRNQPGHDIELDVVVEHAQIQDLLKLGVRTDPSVMAGPVQMHTRMSLTPGDADVADRLKLAGNFRVSDGYFSNQKVQSRLDSLSLRTQGKMKEAQKNEAEKVPTDLRGVFTLKDGLLSFSLLHFMIPGTHVDLAGDYSLDGRTFDFRGTARLDAKLSQMTTGWKSLLLKPVDRFFSKDGAGTEVPVRITGTESEPHFGLDFGHKDEHAPLEKNFDSAQR
ncbi:MAG: AsmA-like C-terminal region-containing protein [Candidatus Sulfotelmatobacter sp.]